MSDDPVLKQLVFYGEHAKEILIEGQRFAPLVFASTPFGTQILPIYHPDGNDDAAVALISKVLAAYDCDHYYLVADSWQAVEGSDKQTEALNIVYASKEACRLITYRYSRQTLGEEEHFVFEEPKEIVNPDLVAGTFKELLQLLHHEPLSDVDKEQIRLMFPILDEDGLVDYQDNYVVN